MVVPIENRQERRPVFFIKEGRQETLKSYLDKNCRQLLGSDVFYDCGNGDLYFITWRDLPIEEGLLPPQYHLVSRLHPRADIYAPYTRFEPRKMVIRKVKKDGGAVEVAIRSFDHILEGVKGKEMSHVGVVKQRASELLDLFFQKPFTEITDEEFELARQKTYQMLAKVGFDPERVLKREKKGWVTGYPKEVSVETQQERGIG